MGLRGRRPGAAIATCIGLDRENSLDPRAYPAGVTVSNALMAAIRLRRNDFHNGWNDTLVQHNAPIARHCFLNDPFYWTDHLFRQLDGGGTKVARSPSRACGPLDYVVAEQFAAVGVGVGVGGVWVIRNAAKPIVHTCLLLPESIGGWARSTVAIGK